MSKFFDDTMQGLLEAVRNQRWKNETYRKEKHGSSYFYCF